MQISRLQESVGNETACKVGRGDWSLMLALWAGFTVLRMTIALISD